MDTRLKEWLKRYSIPELLGILGAYVGVYGYYFISSNPSDLTASVIGTWGENVGYYLLLIISDFRKTKLQNSDSKLLHNSYKTIRGLFLEFGIAELLDSFLIRPAALYFCMEYFGIGYGLLVGKVIADIAFYFPTIFFYEIRKKYNY